MGEQRSEIRDGEVIEPDSTVHSSMPASSLPKSFSTLRQLRSAVAGVACDGKGKEIKRYCHVVRHREGARLWPAVPYMTLSTTKADTKGAAQQGAIMGHN